MQKTTISTKTVTMTTTGSTTTTTIRVRSLTMTQNIPAVSRETHSSVSPKTHGDSHWAISRTCINGLKPQKDKKTDINR